MVILAGVALAVWAARANPTHVYTVVPRVDAQTTVLAFADGPWTLGAVPLRVSLRPTESGSFADRIGQLGPSRVLLVLRGLRAQRQPAVLFELFLSSADVEHVADDAHLIGSLNFFRVPPSKEGSSSQVFESYDVTDLTHRLLADRGLREPPVVTIAPVGEPSPNSRASIQRIELARQ